MKKSVILIIVGLFITSMTCLTFSVNAASNKVYVKSAKVFVRGPYTWLEFELSEQVKPARNFQSSERREEPSDFPDALVTATNKCFILDGISLGEWSEALDGSQYVLMCHFENDDKTGTPYLRILTVPQYIDMNKDFTFEVTSGFITADYKKFNPFKFIWTAETQSFKLEQEGVETTTTTKKPSNTTVTKTNEPSKTQNTQQTVENTTESSETTGTTATGTKSTNAEPIIQTLGSYDIMPKTKDIKIDIFKKTVTLDKKMKVKDFMSNLDVVSGYKLKIFENTKELTDNNAYIRSGSTLKIESLGNTIGELIFEVNQKGNPYMPIVIVLIVVGVLLIVGGALFFLVFSKKKQ